MSMLVTPGRRARALLLALAALPAAALAQAPAAKPAPLYMPRTVKRAMAAGTRSPDGRPGAKYWQNRARYTIAVSVAPPARPVSGREEIVYVNASPDTLKAVVMRLFGNIHKPGAPRGAGAGPDYLTAGVTVDSFAVNGAAAPWGSDEGTFTWKRVALPRPLLPHDSVRMSVRWHYDVSREGNREGAIDSSTFFLAYFYPRVAVYDDTEGWDTIDFTDLQEFYSDFNDYDVTVTVPSSFLVWGTGTLRNAPDVLQPAAAARFAASMTSDTTVRVATRAQVAARAVARQGATNAWHFTSSNVPDVAFAVSDHYDWDAGSVVVDSATGRRASVQAAYNDTAADYRHMVQFGRHALAWLSTRWPGVPYPYEKTTVVQGPAGMEYPMMANDESYPDTTFARFVAEHEIAHTYFPFYMGIDESRYAFMDEGWATTFEYLINLDDMGFPAANEFYQQFRVQGWAESPSAVGDLPIVTPADQLRGGYGINAYGKPSLGYLALKDMLGDATFRRCLHAFMERWHGKHPLPWDFFNTVNDVSGQDLNWFWRSWFFSNGYVDQRVATVAKRGAGWAVDVENLGGLPAPFDMEVEYADGSSATRHVGAAAWKANAALATVTLPKRPKSIVLNHTIWMDAEPAHYLWPAGSHKIKE